MNNQYDPYNNQYNNEYDDQYNNQYNSPYNNQYYGNDLQSFDHQQVPYINKKNNNKGGGFFSLLVAFILLIGCSALLLHFLGIYDLSEYLPILEKFNEVEKKEKTEEKEDSNKESEESEKKEEQVIPGNKEEDKEEENKEEQPVNNDDGSLSSELKAAKGMCSSINEKGLYIKDQNNLCHEGKCIVITDTAGYVYDCSSNEAKRVLRDDIKIEATLVYGCENLDGEGSFVNNDLNISCSGYACTYYQGSFPYIRSCNVR